MGTCRSKSCTETRRLTRPARRSTRKAVTKPLSAPMRSTGAHTFSFHVEGALVRGLVGKDLTRVFELSGNRMIVKAANPAERWRVAWERYDGEPRGGK